MKKEKEPETAAKPAPKTKSKSGMGETTSIQVDKEESKLADSILQALEADKGRATIRMLRINRISILRLALGLGLETLTAKVNKDESIL